MNKRLTYLLILLAIPGLSIGQELRFQQFTMEDGLSNAGTYWLKSIIQDSEGFMWFTTFNGLNRFDGKNFKKYQYSQNSPNGLGDNLTTAICEAEDGRIWAGTSSGVYIFDPETETFELLRHDPANPRSLCGNDINFINKDQDGNMWVGTAVDGVCRWSKEAGDFDNFGGYFRGGLVFFQQKNGTIWVGNSDGLHQKIPGKDEFRRVEMPPEFLKKNIRYGSDIVELPDGSLMVSSGGQGLWTYHPQSQEFKDLSASFRSEFSKSPACLLADRAGIIWMGDIGGIHRYDPVTGQFRIFLHDDEDPASVPMFKVASAYQDAAGSLWFATSGGGVIVSHSPQHPFEIVGDIDVGEVIRLDENRLLINGWEKLGVFDIREGKMVASEIPASLLNTFTLSIALSGKNELWVQQPDIFHAKVFSFESRKTKLVPGRVPWLKAGPDGRIWSGFKYFDEVKNEWVNLYPKISGLPDSSKVGAAIVDIHFGEAGVVWLATNFGIFRYDLGTRQGRKYELHPGDSRSANVVHKIYPGEAGRFYLSTSNGMSMYDPATDGFVSYNESNGLLHNQMTGVVEDGHGNPWICTPKGLHRLDRATRTFTNYGINDGLPNIHFNYQRAYRDDTGHLYFSMAGKLARFHPDSLKPKAYVAPVQLLDFYLNHEKVQPGGQDSLLEKQLRFSQKIQLRHDQADFGFSFVMPAFYKAGELQYFYQLAPYDEDLKSAGTSNEIHYTNMDPGKYTFRVKAKTADGFWSPNEASIAIHIFPPFYRTWWAYLFYLLAAGGLLFGIRRFELRRQSMKAEALRLQELDTLKTRLYTNITHEFRTPLTVILGMTENLKTKSKEQQLESLVQPLKMIERNGQHLLHLVNEMLDLAKIDSGNLELKLQQADIIPFIKYLTESFHSLAAEKHINLPVQATEQTLVMDFDADKLAVIVSNLLSNAIKFTPEGGEVAVRLSAAAAYFSISIKDNGIGIATEEIPFVFDRFYQADHSSVRRYQGTGIGLALTKELVALMKGTIQVETDICENGIIFLKAGLHTETESVVISKPVKIIGENGAILKFPGEPQPLEFPQAAPDGNIIVQAGLHFKNAPGSLIQDIDFQPIETDGNTAILLENSAGSGVMRCQINAFQFGVLVEKSDRTVMMFNTIVTKRCGQ